MKSIATATLCLLAMVSPVITAPIIKSMKSGIARASPLSSDSVSHHLMQSSTSAQHPILLPAPPPSAAKLELSPAELETKQETVLLKNIYEIVPTISLTQNTPTLARITSKIHATVDKVKTNCHSPKFTRLFNHKVEDISIPLEKWTSRTYSQTITTTSVRRDHSDLLVVGVVLLFMLAVVLTEIMDCVTELTRATLNLPEAIRLEDEEGLPAYLESEDTNVPFGRCQKCICEVHKFVALDEKV